MLCCLPDDYSFQLFIMRKEHKDKERAIKRKYSRAHTHTYARARIRTVLKAALAERGISGAEKKLQKSQNIFHLERASCYATDFIIMIQKDLVPFSPLHLANYGSNGRAHQQSYAIGSRTTTSNSKQKQQIYSFIIYTAQMSGMLYSIHA